MVYELIVANKRTGQIFDLSTITTEVTYTTNRTGQPGTLARLHPSIKGVATKCACRWTVS